MANTFDWVEIRAKDVGQAARFYEGLFGWKVVRKEATEGSDYWIFDTGDQPRVQNLRRGGICLRPDAEATGVVVYILVDDIDTVLKKATELGGEIVAPKAAEGPAFRAYFADPSGNVFGLWEETMPE
jgi:predicted enzyme related to lactoylglutathione lyase